MRETSSDILNHFVLTKNNVKSYWSELMEARNDIIGIAETTNDFRTLDDMRDAVKKFGIPVRYLVNNIAWERLNEYWLCKDKVQILLSHLKDPEERAVMSHLYLLTEEAADTARVLNIPITKVRKLRESAIEHLDAYLGINPEEQFY